MASKKPQNDSGDNTAPSGRGLWNAATVETPEQIEKRRALEVAQRAADAKAETQRVKDQEKREEEQRTKAVARRARIIAPFAAYSKAIRNRPLVTIPISVISLALVAFGGIQISNFASSTPFAVANRYLEALRNHDLATIGALEGDTTTTNWLPEEILDQIELSQPVSQSSSWNAFDESAEITFSFDELRDDITVNLTKNTSFGLLGWEYSWIVTPKITEVTFGAEKDLGATVELVFGAKDLGTVKSPPLKDLLGSTFRVVPGMVKYGSNQNGFLGGSTSATQIGNDAHYELNFRAPTKDQDLLDQAAAKALQSVETQVSNCVNSSCTQLKWDWKDKYFSFDSEAPFYWTYKSWSDSYTYSSCYLSGRTKVMKNISATVGFQCTYQIDRYITWEYDDVEIAYQSGLLEVVVDGSVVVTTNEEGSRLKAGKAKFSEFYFTDFN